MGGETDPLMDGGYLLLDDILFLLLCLPGQHHYILLDASGWPYGLNPCGVPSTVCYHSCQPMDSLVLSILMETASSHLVGCGWVWYLTPVFHLFPPVPGDSQIWEVNFALFFDKKI